MHSFFQSFAALLSRGSQSHGKMDRGKPPHPRRRLLHISLGVVVLEGFQRRRCLCHVYWTVGTNQARRVGRDLLGSLEEGIFIRSLLRGDAEADAGKGWVRN